MMRGAEALLRIDRIIGKKVVIKERVKKKYRIKELDERLRKERTRNEARLLHKAKKIGIKCPVVLLVDDYLLGMEFIKGKKMRKNEKNAKKAAEILGKLHEENIIHGDFTPNNIIETKEGLVVIDFGLGFVSDEVEHKAVDLLTFIKSMQKYEKIILKNYKNRMKEKIIERIDKIRERMRYM